MIASLQANKPPRLLYQYQPADCKTIGNLSGHRLYFSKPANFNDAFDCNFCPAVSEPSDEELVRLFHFFRDQQTEKDAFDRKFLDLASARPNGFFSEYVINRSFEIFERGQTKALNETGVVCLSAVPPASWAKDEKSMLMWSHYAEKSTGFCLEFDTSYEPFSAALHINYDRHGYTATCSEMLMSTQDALMLMLRTKAECWDYEREWRIFGEQAGSLKPYDQRALRAVYLGMKIDPTFKKQIKEIIEAWPNRVEVKDMRGMSSMPQFGFSRLAR